MTPCYSVTWIVTLHLHPHSAIFVSGKIQKEFIELLGKNASLAYRESREADTMGLIFDNWCFSMNKRLKFSGLLILTMNLKLL